MSSPPTAVPTHEELLATLASLRNEVHSMRQAGMALEKEMKALKDKQAQAPEPAPAPAPAPAPVAPTHAPSAPRPKAPSPPEFNGTKVGNYEIDTFIREMKMQFDFYGASVFPDDAARVRHAAFYLKGRAGEWWEAEDKTTGILDSWDMFVERLHERYRPMHAPLVARQRLDRLKQTGSVSAYADLFQRELTPIKDMSVSDQIFRFVQGLSSAFVASKVTEQMPKTLHEAFNIAIRAEAYGAGRKSHSAYSSRSHQSDAMDLSALAAIEETEEAGPAPRAGVSASNSNLVDALAARLGEVMQHRLAALQSSSSSAEQLNAMNARVPGLKYQDMERLMKEGRCFYCREQGHMKQACPKRKSEMQKKPLN